MSSSESFSSLSELIDSTLSQYEAQASASESPINQMIRNSVQTALGSSVSEASVLQHRPFVLPGLNLSTSGGSQATRILAKQISNTIIARETERRRKEEEEQKNYAKPEPSTEDDEDEMIDLTKCLIPYDAEPVVKPSPSPEMEKFEITFIDNDDFICEEVKVKEQKLPRFLNSFNRKRSRSKVSAKHKKHISSFGRAICAKYIEVQLPYNPVPIKTDIVRFDFSTPSPDDVINATIPKRVIQPRIFF